MKPDDKDLSFKASLWFLNYHFQLLFLGEIHYGFVIRFIFAGGRSIRGSEILSSLAFIHIRLLVFYTNFERFFKKLYLKVKIRTMNCITVFKTRV